GLALHMLLVLVEALDDALHRLGVDAHDLAAAALLLAGEHNDFITALDLRLHGMLVDILSADETRHHSTSGASEMIFMNPFSRSSRATGPNTRVPRGLRDSGSMITTALSSKRTTLPSRRCVGNF